MIRITVELVPYGVEANKKVIATGIIINDGTGSVELGNYDATFTATNPLTGKPLLFISKVKKFHRIRDVWSLMCEAIANIKE